MNRFKYRDGGARMASDASSDEADAAVLELCTRIELEPTTGRTIRRAYMRHSD